VSATFFVLACMQPVHNGMLYLYLPLPPQEQVTSVTANLQRPAIFGLLIIRCTCVHRNVLLLSGTVTDMVTDGGSSGRAAG